MKVTEIGRYHYVWPDADRNGQCRNPDCKQKVHFVVTMEEQSTTTTGEDS